MVATGNNIELLVRLGIADGESKKNLNAQIVELQRQLDSVKIDVKINPESMKALNTLANTDFSKMASSLNEFNKKAGETGQAGKKAAQEMKIAYNDIPAYVDKAMGKVSQHISKEMKKGLTNVNEIKQAFKGMDAEFKGIYSGVDSTGAKQLEGMIVKYKNLQGQMEKVKMVRHQLAVSESVTKPVWLPSEMTQATEKITSDFARMTNTVQQRLAKLRSEGKITEDQFKKLMTASINAAQGSTGKGIESNYARLNQRIEAAVQSTKQQSAAMREQEAQQKRLIDNENRRKNLLIDIERAIKNQARGFNTEGARGLLDQTRQLDVSSKSFGQTLAANRTALRQMNAEATAASRNNIGVIEAFKVAMEKFPIWMAASTLFYGSVRGAREFMEIIIDIDTKMTSISKVVEDGTDLGKIFDSATESAERFGQSISSVLDSYSEFARQGFKGDELAGLADSALVAANVGELTAQKASEYMTSALIQWRMSTDESMGIIDS